MLKPTNDPLKVMQRESAEAAREMAAAFDSGGTQPFQAVRKLQAQIEELTGVVVALGEVVEMIPVTLAREHVGGGFSPTGSWATVATVVVPRPAGKDVAEVMAQASVALNWSVNAADAWPAVSSRLVVDGNVGPALPMSQGVSVAATTVTGRMAGAVNRARTVTGTGDITVQLQVAITGWIGDGAHNASFSGGIPQVAAMVAFAPTPS